MRTICFLMLFLFLGLFSGLLPAQEWREKFEISEGIYAQLILENKKLSVMLPGEKRQIILRNLETEPEIVFKDINGDGFTDFLLNFPWKYGHRFGKIFLFNQKIAKFKEFKIKNEKLIDTELIEPQSISIRSSIFPSGTMNRKIFKFQNDAEVSLVIEEKSLQIPETELTLNKKIYYNQQENLKDSVVLQYGDEVEELYAYVFAEKTELFEKPEFGAVSKGYLIRDDQFLILDFNDNNWLKIRFHNENLNRDIEGWVNATELILNKYNLEFKGENQDGQINLSLLYPYYEEKSMFVFSIGLTNNSPRSFSIDHGHIFILLENPDGQRYLYNLYGVHSETLPPKKMNDTYGNNKEGKWYAPSNLLDDNTVVWEKDLQNFLIYHTENE